MESLNITGFLQDVTEIQTIATAKGALQKRYAVLDTTAKYHNVKVFELLGDGCALFTGIRRGAKVTVCFDVRCNLQAKADGTKTAFTSLVAWRVTEHPRP
jgi:hypothetical protein